MSLKKFVAFGLVLAVAPILGALAVSYFVLSKKNDGPAWAPNSDHAIIVCKAVTKAVLPAALPIKWIDQTIDGDKVALTFSYPNETGTTSTISRRCRFEYDHSERAFKYSPRTDFVDNLPTIEELKEFDPTGKTQEEIQARIAELEEYEKQFRASVAASFTELFATFDLTEHYPVSAEKTVMSASK